MDTKTQWNSSTGPATGPEPEGGGVMRPSEEPVAQMPLSMMAGEGEDPLLGLEDASFQPGRKRSHSGLLLLLLVLVVGGGTLVAMRVTGTIGGGDSQSLAEAEQRIEEALRRFLGDDGVAAGDPSAAIDNLFEDTDQAISVFADDPTQKQVGLEGVQKNPFELFVKPPEDGGGGQGPSAAQVQREERLKQLRKEYEGLRLQSVLNGVTPVAVISNNVVKEGQTLGSFTVQSISPYGVRLTAEGNTYTLKMEEPEEGGAGRRPGANRYRR